MGILAQSGGSPRSDTSGPGALYTLWGPRGSEPVRVSRRAVGTCIFHFIVIPRPVVAWYLFSPRGHQVSHDSRIWVIG